MKILDSTEGVGTDPISLDLIATGSAVGATVLAFPGKLTDAYSYLQLVISNMSIATDADLWLVFGIAEEMVVSGELNCSRVDLRKLTDDTTTHIPAGDVAYMPLTTLKFTNGMNNPGALTINITPALPSGLASAKWSGTFTTSTTSVYTVDGAGYCALKDVDGFMICGTTDFTTFPEITMDYTLYGYPKAAL